MKRAVCSLLITLLFVAIFASTSQARRTFLNEVNEVCGSSFSCDLCHIDPKGGGPLTSEGEDYLLSGKDPCVFCPNAPACSSGTCTDRDGDGYFFESSCGTTMDCNDNDPAINPGELESCADGIDNDCDDRIDCADNDCSSAPICDSQPEVCNDGIDNDGDRKVDCADKKDCSRDPACSDDSGDGSAEGKGRTCSDGKDNDGDGLFDCLDPDCSRNKACR